MTFFPAFTPNASISQSEQGQLASSYTNALSDALEGSPELANYVGWLYLTQSGATVAEAIAVRDAVLEGDFTLSGLFGAAQSKTGAVAGSNLADPVPLLEVNGVVVDLSAMMDDLETFTWNTTTKSGTVYHTREFYTDTHEPAGYDDGWFDNGGGGGDPEWQEGTYTFVFNELPGNDPVSLSYQLEGTQWQNVQLSVTGNGDYNSSNGNENVTLSGDVGSPAPGAYSVPAASGNTEGSANYVNFGPDVLYPTVAQYSDGSIDLTADFSSNVNGGTVTVVLTYEWA